MEQESLQNSRFVGVSLAKDSSASFQLYAESAKRIRLRFFDRQAQFICLIADLSLLSIVGSMVASHRANGRCSSSQNGSFKRTNLNQVDLLRV